MTNSQETQGHWDEIHSTYWWKGYYLPGEKKLFFKGYAKKYGHNEAKDKEYLLIKKVLMLQQHGYIEKTSKIEIHKRIGACCMANDPIILTLHRDSFIMGDEILTNKTIYKDLKAIYENRSGAAQPAYVISKPKEINISTDIQVKAAIDKKYFKIDDVYTEIHRLQSIGVAHGHLTDCFNKIIQKNPTLK